MHKPAKNADPLAHALDGLIRASGRTLPDIGAEAGVSAAAIWHFRMGLRDMRLSKLRALFAVFNCELSYKELKQ